MSRRPWTAQALLVLLAALVGIALTVSLGLWQLGRAAEKNALAQAREQQRLLEPLQAAQLQLDPAPLQTLLYRRVQLQGQWLHAHTVFLENRQMQGRPGFFAVTPLQLSAPGAPVVLVQRGWVPRAFTDRSLVPTLPRPAGTVQVEGVLAPWPSRIYDFGETGEGPIRQNLDFASYRRSTGLALLGLSVQQSGPAEDGLWREWPQVASGAEKHHGYAFQWFALATLILALYVWFQIVQPRRQARRA